MENKAQEKQLDEVLDDEEPVVLSVDKRESQTENLPELTNDRPDLHYDFNSRIHGNPKSQTRDEHGLPVHEFLEKQKLNFPELGLHETPSPKAQSSPINKKGLKKDNKFKDKNKKQNQASKGNNGKTNSVYENTKHTMNDEPHDDATVTTKKSHHIPKPSTPLHELENAFQNNLEYDLKNAAEDKITNKSLENVQKHKTDKKAKEDSDDDTQLINLKDLHTSSDNDNDGMLKNTLSKRIISFKANSISNQRISDRFKDIYHIDYKKKTTAKGRDVILTPESENTTFDEPVLTEYEEKDDKLKSYYNQGKLITEQTVKDIIDGKNVFLTYTNEYPIGGRRDLDDSAPESIEPDVGELVSKETHVDNYDPVDGTIDGLGPVIIDKNITDNGTKAKKHHHHHHHNQHHHHHHENKTRQQSTGFPGNLPDLFFLDASQNENIMPD